MVAAMRPVVKGRLVSQIEQPGALTECAGKVRRGVAGCDQQIARFQDCQHLLQVVEMIHVLEAEQAHAGRRLGRAALGPCVPVLHIHEVHPPQLQQGAQNP